MHSPKPAAINVRRTSAFNGPLTSNSEKSSNRATTTRNRGHFAKLDPTCHYIHRAPPPKPASTHPTSNYAPVSWKLNVNDSHMESSHQTLKKYPARSWLLYNMLHTNTVVTRISFSSRKCVAYVKPHNLLIGKIPRPKFPHAELRGAQIPPARESQTLEALPKQRGRVEKRSQRHGNACRINRKQ